MSPCHQCHHVTFFYPLKWSKALHFCTLCIMFWNVNLFYFFFIFFQSLWSNLINDEGKDILNIFGQRLKEPVIANTAHLVKCSYITPIHNKYQSSTLNTPYQLLKEKMLDFLKTSYILHLQTYHILRRCSCTLLLQCVDIDIIHLLYAIFTTLPLNT